MNLEEDDGAVVCEEIAVEFEVGNGGITLEDELEDGRLVDGTGGVNRDEDWSTVELAVEFDVGKGGKTIVAEKLEEGGSTVDLEELAVEFDVGKGGRTIVAERLKEGRFVDGPGVTLEDEGRGVGVEETRVVFKAEEGRMTREDVVPGGVNTLDEDGRGG